MAIIHWDAIICFVMSGVASIYILQQIDDKIAYNAARVSDINDIISDSTEVDRATEEYLLAKSDVATVRRDNDILQGEIDIITSKKSDCEKRLYSGLVSNPKELGDLESQGVSLANRITELEDKKIDLMISEEEKEKVEESCRLAMDDVIATKEQLVFELNNELKVLNDGMVAYHAERDVALNSVDEAYLREYEKKKSKVGGRAVVLVVDGVCNGCGLLVATSNVQDARSGTKLVVCDGCSRFLYVK